MADYSDYGYQQPQASSTTGSQWFPEMSSDQLSNAQMQDWMRAFPRPRQNRVMKPRSAGNSPSSAVRRRTAIAQNGMYGMPNQYHQSALEAAILASNAQNTRPISWHPSSARTRGFSNPIRLPDYASEAFVTMTMQDQPMHGLPTDSMMSYPVSAGPTFSTGYFPEYADMQDSLAFQQQTPSLSVAGSQVEPITWDTTANADFSGIDQSTSDGWTLDMLSMANNIPPAETTCPSYASVPSPGEMSGPSTPDFLPIQHFDDESAFTQKKVGKPEEELVGMGLYSHPSNALGQIHQGTLGKGLKLEETFSPSDDENDDEADAEGEVDDEVNDFGSTQPQFSPQEQLPMAQPSNFPIPKQSSKQALNLLHKSFFFDNDDSDQHVRAPVQRYPDLTQPCMTYGYYRV
ncbi:uncharacterized protein N7496_006813 [Penicillium cataractarum]|uniref:Uncharacterized protein n=1 Tax=Penicillium cataractarum TaxID=2100454 RepID=A0A9W9V8Z7_9EURO|nr:uncharacterized protein N7496_006813 [Penicillium cataractarum]KAJ5370721.1 hypothetical protein N7496_006813 [Penicillium cataractarum]